MIRNTLSVINNFLNADGIFRKVKSAMLQKIPTYQGFIKKAKTIANNIGNIGFRTPEAIAIKSSMTNINPPINIIIQIFPKKPIKNKIKENNSSAPCIFRIIF